MSLTTITYKILITSGTATLFILAFYGLYTLWTEHFARKEYQREFVQTEEDDTK